MSTLLEAPVSQGPPPPIRWIMYSPQDNTISWQTVAWSASGRYFISFLKSKSTYGARVYEQWCPIQHWFDPHTLADCDTVDEAKGLCRWHWESSYRSFPEAAQKFRLFIE
jgi:hypothetical protein